MINKNFPSASHLSRDLFPCEAPNKKSAYIVLVNVMKIEGIWQTMSVYLTWVYEHVPHQLTSDVIDEMSHDYLHYFKDQVYARKKSQILILHSCTNEKIERVTRHTAKIFAQALTWDKKDLAQLNSWIDEMNYTWVQLNPWFRGCAAIVKWLDAILRKVHDLELVPYHPDKQMDLEIHATPYMPNYLKNHAINYPTKQDK